MSPHLLFIGAGAGSWEIRGKQLGRAMGARVTTGPSSDDFAWADVIVLVKRAIETHGTAAQATGKRVIWDALDFWKQPNENVRTVADMGRFVVDYQRSFGIAHVIGATRAMANAVGGTYVPHHHRPGLIAADVQPTLATVAYEGTRKYLGSWGKSIEAACQRLGLRFVINPPDLRDADLVVAFRGEEHDGEICRQWKSGVKIVNAMAAGRPILSQPCAAFSEIQPPGEIVASPADIEGAIASWQSLELRTRALVDCRARAAELSLDTIARNYASVLNRTWRQAA